jgi:hypothetical protein
LAETWSDEKKSLPKVLRRVAYPVEPFGFMFIPRDLPPPLPDGIRDRLGKAADLFDQLEKGQAHELQGLHKAVLLVPLSL